MHNVHDHISRVLRKKIRELDIWIRALETKGHLFDLKKLARSLGAVSRDANMPTIRRSVVSHLKSERSKLFSKLQNRDVLERLRSDQ